MEIGIDSFVEIVPGEGASVAEQGKKRVRELLQEAELADRVGLDVFGIGEHHRPEYIASSPAVLLAAMAARTDRIRLASAVTVLSSDDPVRVFQDFATVDLISQGRAEIIVGRGSFIESYPLFGFDMKHYDELFLEKLQLLIKLREETYVHWEGKHRASLTGQGVFPRPSQKLLPIRLGVGGTPQSFLRAGQLGLPLTVAIIGGEPHRFRPLIDMYRKAGQQAGHSPEQLTVAVHATRLRCRHHRAGRRRTLARVSAHLQPHWPRARLASHDAPRLTRSAAPLERSSSATRRPSQRRCAMWMKHSEASRE